MQRVTSPPGYASRYAANEMTTIQSLLFCLILLSSSTSALAQDKSLSGTEGPASVFDAFKRATESEDWKASVDNFSPATTKRTVFEMIFVAGESPYDSNRKAFADVLSKHEIDYDLIQCELYSRLGEEVTPDDFIDAIIASCKDVNAFLCDSYAIFAHKSPSYEDGLRDLIVDENRARAVAIRINYGWSTSPKGDTQQFTYRTEEPVFFRKYGERWKLCVEGEWHDPKFKYVID